jgi:colanic acid biosynthesis glycosyl transferase WcaI
MSANKSITIITPNYYPEDTAIGYYTTDFANNLVSRGFDVQIITGFPYYPKWKIEASYQEHPSYYKETIDNITIYRYKMFLPKKVNFIGRIIMMLSLLKGTYKNIQNIQKTDLVFCVVPFTLFIFPAFLLAKKTKAPLWIHVQDFEFDLAFETGVSQNFFSNFMKSFVLKLEKYLLNKGAIISSISYNMLKKIQDKTNKKIAFYFPNWVSSEKINPLTAKNHRFFNENAFSVLYSGNIGQKQDWVVFVSLCEKIKVDDGIEIIVVGDGAFSNELKAKTKAFSFVKFYDPVPFCELNDLLCSADLHLLFQKTKIVDTVMPSKILGMLASGKPSIVTGNKDSEVKTIFDNANCGCFLNQNNSIEIYEMLLQLKNNIELGKNWGNLGRNYILKHFSEFTVLENTIDKINRVLSNSK